MTDALMELLRRAQNIKMTPSEAREQRVSFVYGNTHIENERITREMVDEVESLLSKEPRSS